MLATRRHIIAMLMCFSSSRSDKVQDPVVAHLHDTPHGVFQGEAACAARSRRSGPFLLHFQRHLRWQGGASRHMHTLRASNAARRCISPRHSRMIDGEPLTRRLDTPSGTAPHIGPPRAGPGPTINYQAAPRRSHMPLHPTRYRSSQRPAHPKRNTTLRPKTPRERVPEGTTRGHAPKSPLRSV